MDELEILKKQWQNQEQALPHLSYKDIYKMLLKILKKYHRAWKSIQLIKLGLFMS